MGDSRGYERDRCEGYWAAVTNRESALGVCRQGSADRESGVQCVIDGCGSICDEGVCAGGGVHTNTANGRPWHGLILAIPVFVIASHVVEMFFFFFQAEDGIRDSSVTGVQTCALPI